MTRLPVKNLNDSGSCGMPRSDSAPFEFEWPTGFSGSGFASASSGCTLHTDKRRDSPSLESPSGRHTTSEGHFRDFLLYTPSNGLAASRSGPSSSSCAVPCSSVAQPASQYPRGHGREWFAAGALHALYPLVITEFTLC